MIMNPFHCVKRFHIHSFPGPNFPTFGLNTDQKNYENGQFLCSVLRNVSDNLTSASLKFRTKSSRSLNLGRKARLFCDYSINISEVFQTQLEQVYSNKELLEKPCFRKII